jgi:hypothetical protein
MIKEFKSVSSAENHQVQKALSLKKELEIFFEKLMKKKLPSKDYSLRDLKAFVISLINNQRKKDGFWRENGYWSLLPAGMYMPKDARVDFVYEPTYIAISILTIFLKRYPQEALVIDRYIDSLHDGIYFASTGNLKGATRYSIEETFKYLKMFSDAGVLEYVCENVKNDERLKPFYETVIGWFTYFLEHVHDNKKLVYGFSEIDQTIYKRF